MFRRACRWHCRYSGAGGGAAETRDGNSPHVVLLVGVNGSGKTTTAGKLAQHWRQQGMSVMLAAGDTSAPRPSNSPGLGRAHRHRGDCRHQGGDAAALAYQALEAARSKGIHAIIDTAGRSEPDRLMDELAKVVRVIRKLDETAPRDW